MSTAFQINLRVPVAVSVGIVWIAGLLIGCHSGDVRKQNARDCAAIEQSIDLSARIDTLNLLSEAFAARCDELVVKYGAQARSRFRHKSFSVTRETANVFVPDGTFIDYVMESYERG